MAVLTFYLTDKTTKVPIFNIHFILLRCFVPLKRVPRNLVQHFYPQRSYISVANSFNITCLQLLHSETLPVPENHEKCETREAAGRI